MVDAVNEGRIEVSYAINCFEHFINTLSLLLFKYNAEDRTIQKIHFNSSLIVEE